MRRTALAVLACLALAGCAAEQQATPPPPSNLTTTATASPTLTREIKPSDIRRMYSGGLSTAGMSCTRGVAPTDPVCGAFLSSLGETVTKVQDALRKWFPNQDLTKANEAADGVARQVKLLRDMGCYGMNGDKKPGKNESRLCGTFASTAQMSWLAYQSTVDQL